jgi:hypothetical protein
MRPVNAQLTCSGITLKEKRVKRWENSVSLAVSNPRTIARKCHVRRELTL